VLEEQLDEFEGTVLAVSHDRYFLDRVVSRIVELDSRKIVEYVGGWSDYQESKMQDARGKRQEARRVTFDA
jgi:ATPase subunit of ABC transporter with duplicated ATPase domains